MNWIKIIRYITICMAFSSQLNAQNLIINGDFAANIDGWDYNSNNANWVSDDGASISGNGSFRFGKILTNNGFRWSASEPMTVIPGYTYEVAVSAKIPVISAANFVGVLMYWYDAGDNLISQDYFSSAIVPFPKSIWEDMYAEIKAPDETAYGIIWLTLSVGEGGSPDEAFVLWDDVIMLADTIFISGFDD